MRTQVKTHVYTCKGRPLETNVPFTELEQSVHVLVASDIFLVLLMNTKAAFVVPMERLAG